ncbi:MAG TPA: hypothetical protein VEX38_09195 [Fimbriimonadaceae bacterium]|nr:hypothetical protein [Fimbriimonadaceae bacterium]
MSKPNVYGENHEGAEREPNSIREQLAENPDASVGEILEQQREEHIEPGGGMGRQATPDDGVTQGEYSRPDGQEEEQG